ncbi:TetR/AcrR family transcriptional regulator [Tsukamurella sp. 1534]|uniref:TetR/AcrR family transcriptional regulator n=1 Tax=Tsukamurella sp. 1534 TaxID=1151061 RepID=UPI000593E65B|nr:TetR/AcrR family transcriptional regulator [Tsukamurella sp. 1534]
MNRTPSRPRKAEAIFSATLELLAEHGYDALTVEAIAARAAVNKTTIYRTWATKDEVFADALLQAPQLAFEIPDTGSLRGDLVALGQRINRLLTHDEPRRIITAALAALPDRPATAHAARTFFADRLQREQVIFERAHARGELADMTDAAMIVDLIGGDLWLHTVARAKTADDTHIERVVDIVLAGVTT